MYPVDHCLKYVLKVVLFMFSLADEAILGDSGSRDISFVTPLPPHISLNAVSY